MTLIIEMRIAHLQKYGTLIIWHSLEIQSKCFYSSCVNIWKSHLPGFRLFIGLSGFVYHRISGESLKHATKSGIKSIRGQLVNCFPRIVRERVITMSHKEIASHDR